MHTDTIQTLEQLRDALASVVLNSSVELRSGGGSDREVIDQLCLAGDLIRLGESLLVSATEQVQARSEGPREERLTVRHGATRVHELIRAATRCDKRTALLVEKAATLARRDLCLTTGELLPGDFPELTEALRHGAIGLDGFLAATGPLVKARHRIDPVVLVEADRALAAAAHGTRGTDESDGTDALPPLDAEDLGYLAKRWAAYADQDGAEPTEEVALRKRSLTLGPEKDGVIAISGWLLPDVASQLERLWSTINNPRHHCTDKLASPDGAGGLDDAAGADSALKGSATQKRHDAFATILEVAARSAEIGTIGGAAPTLVITMRAEDYAAGQGWAHLDGLDVPTSFRAAQRIACTGTIQRVLHDDAGRIIDIHTIGRVFNAHQRRAITARDRECIIPGCHVQAAWCEIHHVHEHSRGGPTHTDNGVLLCWTHHRTLGCNGWEIRMVGGVPEVRGPRWWDRHQHWRAVSPALTDTS